MGTHATSPHHDLARGAAALLERHRERRLARGAENERAAFKGRADQSEPGIFALRDKGPIAVDDHPLAIADGAG